MKKIRLLLLPLLLLLSGGFTATQQTVLFSGGCPTIGGACPSINANFQTGKYWVQGVGYVPLTSIVSTTRASSKTCANTAGVLTSVGNNVLCVTDQGALIEEARTNSIPNNSMVGAVAGTPGTEPNLWGVPNTTMTGLTRSVIGTGTENGMTYIDYRVVGTPGSSSSYQWPMTSSTEIVASNGQIWSGRYYIRLVGGSASNVGNFYFQMNENTAAGAFVTTGNGTSVPLTSTISTVRYTRTLSGGGTVARVLPILATTLTSGNAVDVTFRIYVPQMELGSFSTSTIFTTNASATRAADVPQLIGPALTAALAAKSAFFQTTGVGGGTAPRLLHWDVSNGAAAFFASSTTVSLQNAAGAATATGTVGSGTYATTIKSAIGFDATSLTVKANAGTLATSANAMTGQTGIAYIANRSTGDRALNGYYQKFALSPQKGVFDNSTTP